MGILIGSLLFDEFQRRLHPNVYKTAESDEPAFQCQHVILVFLLQSCLVQGIDVAIYLSLIFIRNYLHIRFDRELGI